MPAKRLMTQIYPSFLIIIVFAVIITSYFALNTLDDYLMNDTAVNLQTRATLIQKDVKELLLVSDFKTINELCVDYGVKTSTRYTIVLPDGEVVGDSYGSPAVMDSHARRKEMAEALSDTLGYSVRYSQTLQRKLMYVALPLKNNGEIIAVIRTSIPITDIEEELSSIYGKIALGGILAAILTAIFSYLISRRISKPLEEIKKGAVRFADGELKHRLAVPNLYETGALAEAMNQMAEQLNSRIEAAIRQRNEKDAVLASMIEGVLAVDNDENLMILNSAAEKLFGLEAQEAEGRTLQEVIRNIELQQFILDIIKTQKPREKEIAFLSEGERFLQMHGTVLKDTGGRGIGVLVVVNDVTHLRKLEQVRRDFVANVSHELKTPITSIKGYVETLLDGASEDKQNEKKFLEVIARQTNRLNAIIEDLLNLSKIEQGVNKSEIVLESAKISSVLKSAIEICQSTAEKKNIKIKTHLNNDPECNINAALLEQAIANLLDNAIKFSDPDQSIELNLVESENEISISVVDFGCGIGKNHLPRLFERFYRVDKARSRSMGGTGLGLAIVKHIAIAHGGRVSVRSILGQGSTFQIHLPRGQAPVVI